MQTESRTWCSAMFQQLPPQGRKQGKWMNAAFEARQQPHRVMAVSLAKLVTFHARSSTTTVCNAELVCEGFSRAWQGGVWVDNPVRCLAVQLHFTLCQHIVLGRFHPGKVSSQLENEETMNTSLWGVGGGWFFHFQICISPMPLAHSS